jgi:queuosine precursor transporter
MKYKIYPDKISPLYVVIAGLFICFLMISNIIVGRLVSIGEIIVNGDFFLFPLTYIIGDILTEVYGFQRTRLVIWLGFLTNIIMAIYFSIVLKLPFPKEFTTNQVYTTVLGNTPIIVFASITAYFLGEFSNSITLSVMKKLTKGKWLWTRTIGSTIVGQIFDTGTFMLIVFHALPQNILIQLMLIAYSFKVGYEILATPITYFVIEKIKKLEHLDVFDYGVKYNPFAIQEEKSPKNNL